MNNRTLSLQISKEGHLLLVPVVFLFLLQFILEVVRGEMPFVRQTYYISPSDFLIFFPLDVGVFQAMVDTWGPQFYTNTKIYGGSSGTVIALGITTGKTPEFMDALYQSIAIKTKYTGSSLFGSFFYEQALRGIVRDSQDYKLIENRCYFSTNGFFANLRWHTAWKG
jgi:hypothetical protein